MAIKVIKQGKPPQNDRMKGRCTNCNTEVECLRSDTTPLSDQRDGDANSVKCPTTDCGHTIWVTTF